MPSGSDPSGEHAGSVLNLTVVCLRPQGSANLGSIARAMMNFGFRDLILVNPRCPIDEQSFRMACHADSILRRARTVSRLAELAPEFHAWIGTSGKTDPSAHGEPLLPEDLAAAVIPAAEGHRLALLLGPEDHGLSNQELKMCRWIVRIPACPDYPSLNIAQAAAILLYVLAVPPAVGPPSPHARMPASVEDTEQFFGQLRTLLLDTGFLHRNNPERIMYVLRRIVQRAGPDAREIRILRGILRQLGWAFRQAGFPGGNGEGSEPVDPERFPES